jgi:hypothetical protein
MQGGVEPESGDELDLSVVGLARTLLPGEAEQLIEHRVSRLPPQQKQESEGRASSARRSASGRSSGLGGGLQGRPGAGRTFRPGRHPRASQGLRRLRQHQKRSTKGHRHRSGTAYSQPECARQRCGARTKGCFAKVTPKGSYTASQVRRHGRRPSRIAFQPQRLLHV